MLSFHIQLTWRHFGPHVYYYRFPLRKKRLESNWVSIELNNFFLLFGWRGGCRYHRLGNFSTLFHDLGRICIQCVHSGAVPNINQVSKQSFKSDFAQFFLDCLFFKCTNLMHCLSGCASFRFRQTAIGLSSILSRLGTIVAPSLGLLARYHHVIPPLVYGGLSFISGALCFLLPETRRRELPDSVSEAVSSRWEAQIKTSQGRPWIESWILHWCACLAFSI